MKIAVIGKGNVGSALGGAWTRAGHEVRYSGRDDVQQTADFGDVVAVALPWPATEGVLRKLDLKGKVLMDCTNPIKPSFDGLELGTTTSGGEMVASWASGARVVKAFNSTGANNMENPVIEGRRLQMLYCGDDPGAKETVRKLVQDVGFEAVDAGPLANARLLEPLAMLWVWLAFHGLGRDFAFQIIKR
jgi:predicted dinucleotide-binding enzyme